MEILNIKRGKTVEVIIVKTYDLKSAENNAKIHDKQQIEAIASAIKKYGFIVPILITEDYEVVAGHGRLLAALSLSMTEVPCTINSHLTQEEIRAYRLVDNAVSAGWDMDKLTSEIAGLFDFNAKEFGFNAFVDTVAQDDDPWVRPSSSSGSGGDADIDSGKKSPKKQYKCPGCGHCFNRRVDEEAIEIVDTVAPQSLDEALEGIF